MSDLVEIGVEAIRDCVRANDMREATYVRAILTAIEKAGHRIVPVELTEEMMAAWLDSTPEPFPKTADMREIGRSAARGDWEAFLAAAPKVTP